MVAAIIAHEGRILLVQRPDDAAMGGLWEFPGGKIEPGETPEAALAREIREELGVAIAIGPLYHQTDYRYDSGLNVRLSFFRCRITGGSLQLLWGQALRWVAPGDLLQYPTPAADQEVVARLSGETAV